MMQRSLHTDEFYREMLAFSGKRATVCSYPGNSGDQLLEMGLHHILHSLGVTVVEAGEQADVAIWPGGNLGAWRPNLKRLAEYLADTDVPDMVVGPTSINTWNPYLSSILREHHGRVLAVFARDAKTYCRLKQIKGKYPTIQIGTAPDPATYLVGSAWLADLRSRVSEEHVLAAFRDDHEMRAPPWIRVLYWVIPYRYFVPLLRVVNRKEMEGFIRRVRERVGSGSPLLVEDVSTHPFRRFVDSIVRAKEVHTNRLHVLMLAVLLSKPTFAYPTALNKLKEVCEQSFHEKQLITFLE